MRNGFYRLKSFLCDYEVIVINNAIYFPDGTVALVRKGIQVEEVEAFAPAERLHKYPTVMAFCNANKVQTQERLQIGVHPENFVRGQRYRVTFVNGAFTDGVFDCLIQDRGILKVVLCESLKERNSIRLVESCKYFAKVEIL